MGGSNKEYRGVLNRGELHVNPIEQFRLWFAEVVQKEIVEANAFCLCTATKEGKPSSRMLLLKYFDPHGFVFYTNYNSRKGQDIAENPQASMTFYWKELERQVHLRGKVEKISHDASEAYFLTRSKERQAATWASKQDRVLGSRQELDQAYQKCLQEHIDKRIPLPDYWGGYRLVAQEIEFWQGGAHRLHDRFLYALEQESWQLQRLSP